MISTLTIDYAAAISFLDLIFADLPEGELIELFQVPSNRTFFIEHPEELRELALNPNENVYFGCASVAERPQKGRRHNADQVGTISCLWLDVDIAGVGHQKTNLPTNDMEAREQMDALGFKPSIVVNSGRGFHAYWLFKSCVPVASQPEKQQAIQLLSNWQALLRGISYEKHGWSLDSTHDLARVLRLPGTWNVKTEVPILCKVDSVNSFRYEFDELGDVTSELIGQNPQLQKKYIPVADDPKKIDFDPDTQVDMIAWNVLSANFPKAELIFNAADLGSSDNSPSARDYKLALFAVRAGWTDKQIVALLITHRRNTGADLKLNRTTDCYYSRTVHKVRTLLDEQPYLNEDTAASKAPESLDSDWNFLRDSTGLDIKALEKHGDRDSSYIAKVFHAGELATVPLGSTEDFMSASKFRAKVLDSLAILPNAIEVKGGKWAKVVQVMCNLLTKVEHDTSPMHQTHSWVAAFLESMAGDLYQSKEAALQHTGSFVTQAADEAEQLPCIYIHGPSFQTWLSLHENSKYTKNNLRALLAEAGFHSVVVSAEIESDKSSKKVRVQKRYYKKPEADFWEMLNGTEAQDKLPF